MRLPTRKSGYARASAKDDDGGRKGNDENGSYDDDDAYDGHDDA